MVFRPRRAQSAFHLSLALAFLLLAVESFVLRRAPATAASFQPGSQSTVTQTTTASETEQKRVAARRRARFEKDEPFEQAAQTEAYESALRHACALPRTSLNWRSLGPQRASLFDFCRAEADELARWRAAWLASLG